MPTAASWRSARLPQPGPRVPRAFLLASVPGAPDAMTSGQMSGPKCPLRKFSNELPERREVRRTCARSFAVLVLAERVKARAVGPSVGRPKSRELICHGDIFVFIRTGSHSGLQKNPHQGVSELQSVLVCSCFPVGATLSTHFGEQVLTLFWRQHTR